MNSPWRASSRHRALAQYERERYVLARRTRIRHDSQWTAEHFRLTMIRA